MRVIVLVTTNERGSRVAAASAVHAANTLRALGHDATILAFDPDQPTALSALAGSRADAVVNLAAAPQLRRRGAVIAGLLEMLGLPFTGTGAHGILMCRDRTVSRHAVRDCIPTPAFIEVPLRRRVDTTGIPCPAMVKPRFAGCSTTAPVSAFASSPRQVSARVRWVHQRYGQPAICEEFVAGRGISVGVLGNRRSIVFPAAERRGEPGGRRAERWVQADLSPGIQRQLAQLSRTIQRQLELRDYYRIDFRLTPAGQLVFLHAEPQPDLGPTSTFAMMSAWSGIEFFDLWRTICSLAARRRSRDP